MRLKPIILISILITSGILIAIYFWPKRGPNYIPITPDLENCIIEEIGNPTPYQEICLNKEYPIPTKIYFDNGWRAVCCLTK